MRKVVTEEEKKKACADYVSGMNVYDIARKYHFQKTQIYRYLKEYGIKSDRNDNNYYERIQVLAKEGKSLREIVDALGCKPNTVNTCVRENHLKLPIIAEADKPKVLAAYNDGTPIKEIQDKFYISTTTVYKVLRENGIVLKNQSKARTAKPRVRKEKVSKDGRTLDRSRMTNKLKAIDKKRPVFSEPINCDDEVKSICYYGCLQDSTCSFCITENHSRGCSARECTKFISADDALKIVRGEKND